MLNHPATSATTARRRMAEVIAHEGHGWWCRYCGDSLVPLGTLAAVDALVLTAGGRFDAAPGFAWPSVDHKVPSCRGGTDDLRNLTLACVPCNTRKGRRTADEFYAILSAELADVA